MATASNIDDLLQCPICLDIFRDPKVLDCQHTFCSSCLRIHLANLGSQLNSIDCPICRQRSNLINHSIDSLPGNYIVRDIIERQYGSNIPQRSNEDAQQQIQDRLARIREEKNKKENDDDHHGNYWKPAAAAAVGVIGGLILAKSVKKLRQHRKK